MDMFVALLAAALLAALALSMDSNEDSGLVGHWKLRGDCGDHSGKGNHGINHGVVLTEDAPAEFDGRGGYVEVPNSESLQLGTGDFSIAAWVKCSDKGLGVTGDILSKYDPDLRKGVNFHVSASAPGYSSISDVRNVRFGIDNAIDGAWEDCGRPWPSNPLVGTLIAYKGHLYTGIADAADEKDACRVFRYAGGKEWVDCGRVGDEPNTRSIMAAIIHKGDLYVGTGTYSYWGKGTAGRVHVYRYEGGTNWHDCGRVGEGHRVLSLASFRGVLYASDDAADVYRYDGDNEWTFCGSTPSRRFHFSSLMVYRGDLYGGASTTIDRYRGDGTWETVGQFDPASIDQVHTMGVYGGKLYAGTWSDGKLIRFDGDMDWADCGDLGVSDTCIRNEKQTRNNEINELTVYNGKMYAGVIPKAQVWRYEGGKRSTLIAQLVDNPDYSPDSISSWNRVPCLTIFQGRLYAGTSNCTGMAAEVYPKAEIGKVLSWEAGKSVSYDDDLGLGWKHLAAVREHRQLKLYINGELAAVSSEFDPSLFDLSNNKPLLIGFGAENYFNGEIRDLRLYNRAVTGPEAARLCLNGMSDARS